MSSAFAHATIGTPGQPWGPAEVAQWRAHQVRQRSHADDVLAALAGLDAQWQREPYGELVYGSRRYPLHALRSKDYSAWLTALTKDAKYTENAFGMRFTTK